MSCFQESRTLHPITPLLSVIHPLVINKNGLNVKLLAALPVCAPSIVSSPFSSVSVHLLTVFTYISCSLHRSLAIFFCVGLFPHFIHIFSLFFVSIYCLTLFAYFSLSFVSVYFLTLFTYFSLFRVRLLPPVIPNLVIIFHLIYILPLLFLFSAFIP